MQNDRILQLINFYLATTEILLKTKHLALKFNQTLMFDSPNNLETIPSDILPENSTKCRKFDYIVPF